jgi:hypothetical protein
MAYVGPEALSGGVRRTTERGVATRAHRFLADISGWMREGGSIYSAPEGQITPDGHLSRITSGFHRVLREAPDDSLVIPITIMYDFMTVGRARMFVDMAPAIERAPAFSRDALDARLRAAWMRAARYTCTQLASGYLVSRQQLGHTSFSQAELLEVVMRQARELRAQGRAVDPRLLTRGGARQRVRRYLAFLRRARQIDRLRRGAWMLRPFPLEVELPIGEVAYRTAPLAYAWNELQDMGVLDEPPGATVHEALSA